jgi:hypothetical protein
LWLLARWYYSNPRDGEIFFNDKDWPYRKILRACSRLLLPKEAEADKNKKSDATSSQQSGPNNLDPGKSTP